MLVYILYFHRKEMRERLCSEKYITFHTYKNISDLLFLLSVLTDIDINSYDDDTLGTPTVTSYRMNQDVLCIQPPSLRNTGSFRSARDSTGAVKRTNNITQHHHQEVTTQLIKFRGKNLLYISIHLISGIYWLHSYNRGVRKIHFRFKQYTFTFFLSQRSFAIKIAWHLIVCSFFITTHVNTIYRNVTDAMCIMSLWKQFSRGTSSFPRFL